MVNNVYLYISKQNNPQRKMTTHLNHPTRKAKWSCMPVWTHVALIRGQGKAIPFIVFLLFPQIHNCFIIPNRVTGRHHRLSHTVCDTLRLEHIEKHTLHCFWICPSITKLSWTSDWNIVYHSKAYCHPVKGPAPQNNNRGRCPPTVKYFRKLDQ